MIAVISDVHGNLEALTAVLGELGDAETIYCAGDIIGYGPNPNECCDLIRERGIKCVQGNHDFVCANLDRLDGDDPSMPEEDRELCRRMFNQKNSAAQASSIWTNQVLTAANRRMIRGLPCEINENALTIVHGKPGSKADMLNEYMLAGHTHGNVTANIKGRMLVVGHSHIPMRTSRLVNPGSVGQPRDRNWMASFAVLEDAWYRFSYIRDEDMTFRIVNQFVTLRRTPYNVKATIRKIKEQDGLPDSLGDRLTVGL